MSSSEASQFWGDQQGRQQQRLPGAQLPGAQLPDLGLGACDCVHHPAPTLPGVLGLTTASAQQSSFGGFDQPQAGFPAALPPLPGHAQQQQHRQQQPYQHAQQPQWRRQPVPPMSTAGVQCQQQQQQQRRSSCNSASAGCFRSNSVDGGCGDGGGAGLGGCSINSVAIERGFNTNAPAFTPGGGSCGGSMGSGGVSGVAGLNGGRDIGAGGVMGGIPPGAHYVPTQHQQYVAGAALASLRRTGQSARHDTFFMPETLRAELAANREACLYAGDPNDPRLNETLGLQIRQYHSLLPLDDPQRGKRSRALGVQTSLFRAISETDGEVYTIRRLEAPPLPSDIISRTVRAWAQMSHPNIIRLADVFTTPDEGQPLTYVVQPFYPNALTLEQAFLQQRMPLSEEGLWPIALQMVATVHAAHLAGLAVRALDLSHVLLTGKDAIRLSSCGILDLTFPQSARNILLLQAEDLLSLAHILVNLACNSHSAASQQSLQKSLSYVQATFSHELSQLIMLLLSSQATIHDAVAFTSGRMMTRMSQMQAYADGLLAELSKECENGRLLRLLVKLAHVTDRPTLLADQQWGEHSDRHLLRLYRDSLFHQSDDTGAAVIDFAQTANALNKLDVGHDGKTLLMSPGRQDGVILLVGLRDVRDVLERSFGELVASSHGGADV